MSNQSGILRGTIVMDIRNLDEQQENHIEQLVEKLASGDERYAYHDGVTISAYYDGDNASDAATVRSIIKQLHQDYRNALSALNISRVDIRTGKRVAYRYDAMSKNIMIEESKQQGFVRVNSTPYALV